MEFLEFVFLISVAFLLPLTIIKMGLDYKKAKAQASGGEGTGVTAGELKRLLREAVEDANAPLLARIGDLEDRLQPNLLPEESSVEREPQERTLGRRVAE